MRFLCIGAHPDDVEIGMGGTVASLAARGHELLILDLTNGEPTPHGSPEIRAAESAAAAAVLGVGRKTLGMPNRLLEDTIENRKLIAAESRAFRPQYSFAPWHEDAHPDHIAASRLSEAARFYAKLTKSDIEVVPFFPKRTLYYFPVHLRLRINPSFLLDISEFLEQKSKAIHEYKSQFLAGGKEYLIDAMIGEAKYWGFQGGVAAAEPFVQLETPLLSAFPEGYR